MGHSFYQLCQVMPYVGISILSACSRVTPPTASIEQCPSPTEALPIETVQQTSVAGNTRYFDRFDYAPKSVALDEHTVRFLAREYDFVYCRANNSWTVQPGTLGETWLADLNAADQGNSKFSSVTFNGHPYQYRVVREPNLPTANSPEQTVTLELTMPGQETPQQYPLYTLADVQQTTEQTVTRLGTPRITAAIAHGDRLWWSLAFEQGEGNNGIATIASYDPATDQMILIQPEEIGSDQILDLAITGEAEQLTLWLGLMSRGQPTGHVPGLMAYHLDAGNLASGTMTAYTRYNSPLVGAIPTQLAVDADKLWIGTRNGVCQVDWQTPEVSENWDCWQFIAKATLSEDEAVPVYPSLMSPTPTTSFPVDSSAETIEVLWWVFTKISEPRQGRYEVRLDDGLVMTSATSVSPMISLDEAP